MNKYGIGVACIDILDTTFRENWSTDLEIQVDTHTHRLDGSHVSLHFSFSRMSNERITCIKKNIFCRIYRRNQKLLMKGDITRYIWQKEIKDQLLLTV